MLVIFRGLPGTGKSHLVRQLVEKVDGLHVLSRDAIRAAVVPRPTYSAGEKDLVDDLVGAMAAVLLDRGRSVVIDGMALSSSARVETLVSLASSRHVPFFIVECVCRQATALVRIAGDEGSHPAGDRGEKLYFEVKARFQRVPHPVLTVDTDRADSGNLTAILAYLGQAPANSAISPATASGDSNIGM